MVKKNWIFFCCNAIFFEGIKKIIQFFLICVAVILFKRSPLFTIFFYSAYLIVILRTIWSIKIPKDKKYENEYEKGVKM